MNGFIRCRDIVNALINAGLSIDFLNEHEVVVWKAFPSGRDRRGSVLPCPKAKPKIPLSLFDRGDEAVIGRDHAAFRNRYQAAG